MLALSIISNICVLLVFILYFRMHFRDEVRHPSQSYKRCIEKMDFIKAKHEKALFSLLLYFNRSHINMNEFYYFLDRNVNDDTNIDEFKYKMYRYLIESQHKNHYQSIKKTRYLIIALYPISVCLYIYSNFIIGFDQTSGWDSYSFLFGTIFTIFGIQPFLISVFNLLPIKFYYHELDYSIKNIPNLYYYLSLEYSSIDIKNDFEKQLEEIMNVCCEKQLVQYEALLAEYVDTIALHVMTNSYDKINEITSNFINIMNRYIQPLYEVEVSQKNNDSDIQFINSLKEIKKTPFL